MEKLHCDESDVAGVMSLKPGKSDTPNEYKRKSNENIELLICSETEEIKSITVESLNIKKES